MVEKASNKIISTLIVDDESPARQRIHELLENQNTFEIIDVCSSGKHAVKAINSNNPDLVFLDIQLQDMNGFDVLEKLNKKNLPFIIFVTAYDEYAIKAFDFHALDYLLKPFSDERFEEALEKAHEQIKKHRIGDLNENITQLIADFRRSKDTKNQEIKNLKDQYQNRLVIKSARKIFLIKTKNIDWISAEGPYVSINVSGKSHLKRGSLKSMQEILDPDDFIRIHRSTIININRIRELHSHFHGEFFITLENGKRFKLSRSYRENAERILGGYF